MSLAPEVTIDNVLRSVARRKFFFVGVTLLGMIATLAAFVLMEKKYESEARLFVQLGRSSVGLDPTATTSGTISVMDSRETEIRSIVDLVGSRGVAEEVVKRVGAEKILASKYDFIQMPSLPSNLLGSDSDEVDELAIQYADGRTTEEQKAFEQAVKKFSNDMLSVKSEKKTSVVTIYCKANSPVLAKTLADTVLTVSQELHLKISYVAESSPFFEEEFSSKSSDLEQLEQSREEFLNQRNVLSIQSERSLTQSVLDRLSNKVIDTESELVALTEELKTLRNELANTDEMVFQENSGKEILSRSGADQRLIELKGELANLQSKYKSDHYLVAQMKSRISEVESEVAKRGQTRTENLKQRNPTFEALKLTISQKEASLVAKKRLLEHLKEQLQDENSKLVDLNRDQRSMEEMDRKIDIARAAVFDFAEKRRQSQVLAKLNEQKISNIEVASAGSYVTKHIFPKASLILPLGLMGSLSMATFLSVLRDRQKTNTTSTIEVERNVGVPVLVTLPRVRATVRH